MKYVNSLIQLDVRFLKRPLTTLTPMQLCAYAVEVRNVPDELTDVSIVVFKPTTGEHFEPIQLSQNDNGDWKAELSGAVFPTAGTAKYEMFANSAEGNKVALGYGKLDVSAFDAGSVPIPSHGVIPITEMADQNGIMHTVRAVNVGTEANPDWTMEVEV